MSTTARRKFPFSPIPTMPSSCASTPEKTVFCSDVGIGRVGKRAEILRIFFVLGKQLHDLTWAMVSRRLKHHHVHQAEDGGVDSDPERQHHNRGDGEPRRFPKLPKRKATIVNHNVCAAYADWE